MRARGKRTAVAALGALAGLAGALATPASAEMTSIKLDEHLCKTTGGGKFVKIPGFPGERIDRRLLPDVNWLVDRYHVFITDGFSKSSIHASNGEHPLGLATDIVPNKAKGGRWKTVGKLAEKAEPRQNHPRPPWRWVGYTGDAGHGPHNHLHLSWMHNQHTKFGHPAKTVYTRECPSGDPSTDEPSGGIGSHKGAIELPQRLYRGPAEDE
jgi:hypothetical protein